MSENCQSLIEPDRVRVSRKDAGGLMSENRRSLIEPDRVRVSRKTQEG